MVLVLLVERAQQVRVTAVATLVVVAVVEVVLLFIIGNKE
jgi:hypothetical protein